ncbi:MAG: hypothetical protein QXD48_03690 [Candidatus Aenigmatarchaeota archaeon]
MGWFLDLLKLSGILGVMTTEGTVFGGKDGTGILGKIIFSIPPPPPQPPSPHQHGHYPLDLKYPQYRPNRNENIFYKFNNY